MRINNEIKFWNMKQQLNKTLYSLHIDNVNKWKNTWDIIFQTITEELEENKKATYINLDKNTNSKE
jgi:hypothetical protein